MRQRAGGLVQTVARVAQCGGHARSKRFFEGVDADVLTLADQRVEGPPPAARLVQCDQDTMGGEHTVIDALQVVVADRAPLTAHHTDQLIEQPALCGQRVGHRVDR